MSTPQHPSIPRVALLWALPADSPAFGPLRAAEGQGLTLRSIAPFELRATVGALCGLHGLDAAPAPLPAEPDGSGQTGQTGRSGPAAGAAPAAPALPDGPALIFCGLPEPELTALLAALRAAGAAIPLKAVVTPTNQHWRFGELLAELAREHAALAAQGQK